MAEAFKFFEEIKKRNIVRVGLLYLVTCWLILEPIHVVFHMLEVPVWANRLVLILMALGFPAVLLFAWVFEITPEGLKPTVEVGAHKSIRPLTGRRLDRAIMVVMALAIVYFVADKFWLSGRAPASASSPAAAPAVAVAPASSPAAAVATVEKSIAVLPFVDMSEKKDQEYFSDGLSETDERERSAALPIVYWAVGRRSDSDAVLCVEISSKWVPKPAGTNSSTLTQMPDKSNP
jgi:adenylate cyclase